MLDFKVDKDLCSRCGDCARDCIQEVIEQIQDRLPRIKPERETSCQHCQHCLAVCPTGALSIHKKNPVDSSEIRDGLYPDLRQLTLLVRGRRSVRQYKKENASKTLVRDLLLTLANAPTGGNNRKLTFIVIDDKQVMKSFQEKALTSLSTTVGKGLTKDAWFLNNLAPAVLDKGLGIIFYDAPHLLIVSSPLEVYTAREDVIIALSYFELLAQSAGLGTVWCGIVKSMLESLPDLKHLLHLPENHFYFPMLFGLPAVRYHRTVQRDDAATIQRVSC